MLAGSSPRVEVQLLEYLRPDLVRNPGGSTMRELGFNHICFAVDDLDLEVVRLRGRGIETLNEVMEFHDRKLVFLSGPEGVVVELAQWLPPT